MNKNNIEIYENYIQSNKARNYETINTTYKMYRSRMNDFMKYLEEFENDELLLSSSLLMNCVQILERYIVNCRDRGNNNQTINNKLTAISSFYIWCVKRNLISHHPFQNKLDRLKKGAFDKRRESYYLSTEEIIKAKVLMAHNKFKLMDRIIWELFLDCGARVSALQNIKVGQIDFEKGIIREANEKGGKIVDLMFFENTSKLIREYLDKTGSKLGDYLFRSTKNKYKPICQATIRYKIKKIGKLIGYDELYPHTLRKTSVNMMYNLGGIELATEYANHSDSKTTKDHYVKSRTIEENRDSIARLRRKSGL